MNGTLIPGTPIAVDFWRARQCSGNKVFFLTHFHSDHMQGLTTSWSHKLYCSPLTKELLVHQRKLQPDVIESLEVGESHIVPLSNHSNSEDTMTVTVMDANHCPGAVMYLFEGAFGTILHTGDFRYDPSMFLSSPLCDLGFSKSVDVLYLDDTYCAPKYDFPTRRLSEEKIVDIIEKHPEHYVVLGLRNLGKETILVRLAQHFKTWIVVTPERLEALKVLNLPNVFTTDRSAGFIRVAAFHEITGKAAAFWNSLRPTITLLPTCLYVGSSSHAFRDLPFVHIVPYSDHSSYKELHKFVARINPKKIVPVVRPKKGTAATDLSCFEQFLNESPVKNRCILESIRDISNCGNLYNKVNKPLKRKASWDTVFKSKKPRSLGVVFDDTLLEEPEATEAGEENVSVDTLEPSSESCGGESQTQESNHRADSTADAARISHNVRTSEDRVLELTGKSVQRTDRIHSEAAGPTECHPLTGVCGSGVGDFSQHDEQATGEVAYGKQRHTLAAGMERVLSEVREQYCSSAYALGINDHSCRHEKNETLSHKDEQSAKFCGTEADQIPPADSSVNEELQGKFELKIQKNYLLVPKQVIKEQNIKEPVIKKSSLSESSSTKKSKNQRRLSSTVKSTPKSKSTKRQSSVLEFFRVSPLSSCSPSLSARENCENVTGTVKNVPELKVKLDNTFGEVICIDSDSEEDVSVMFDHSKACSKRDGSSVAASVRADIDCGTATATGNGSDSRTCDTSKTVTKNQKQSPEKPHMVENPSRKITPEAKHSPSELHHRSSVLEIIEFNACTRPRASVEQECTSEHTTVTHKTHNSDITPQRTLCADSDSDLDDVFLAGSEDSSSDLSFSTCRLNLAEIDDCSIASPLDATIGKWQLCDQVDSDGDQKPFSAMECAGQDNTCDSSVYGSVFSEPTCELDTNDPQYECSMSCRADQFQEESCPSRSSASKKSVDTERGAVGPQCCVSVHHKFQ